MSCPIKKYLEKLKKFLSKYEIPLLSIINIPSLCVDTIDVEFNMEVSTQSSTKSSTDSSTHFATLGI